MNLPDGTLLRWQSLAVGGTLQLYGRSYTITSCDAPTRAFMEVAGISMAPDGPAPDGPFDERQKWAAYRALVRTCLDNYPAAVFSNAVNDGYEHFMRLDGKVLRFYAAWNEKQQGFKVPLVLLYYLLDDTVEVHFMDGYDDVTEAFPTLLKRGKLPKNSSVGECHRPACPIPTKD